MNNSDRLGRKRERTRNALLAAARELVFQRGHDRIAIQDITERADVGLGTFYNYFDSKPAIFEAVLEEIQADFRAALDRLRQPLKDPALIVSHTLRFCLQQAQDNIQWNHFLTYSGLTGDYRLGQDEKQCLEDLARGVAAGRFKIDNIPFTYSLMMGMVRHATMEIARGRLDRSAIEETTVCIMRMLGLPDLVARALVQSPLPPCGLPATDPVPAVYAGTGHV